MNGGPLLERARDDGGSGFVGMIVTAARLRSSCGVQQIADKKTGHRGRSESRVPR